ncbi:Cj0814 family flagellar-dependent secreted protein [Campylobacter sp. RM9331]|uniref:Cj0814 family flagellar-dependent secreted protein n=2 Tax=unclassified Campylobacter TaxID=2593542 RepID=UPI001D420CE9|nr:hypothetical protein [Campylobacter sp. RM9331]
MKINSYSTYQITNISKKETNNEIKKVDNKADDKKVGVVLGYGVDKDGFFTSDFNKAAGIAEDFKIHSDSLKSLVEHNENAISLYKICKSIDIAKSVGNAYNVVRQVVGDEFLNSNDSFSKDTLSNTPHLYEMRKSTLEVTQIFDNDDKFNNYFKSKEFSNVFSKHKDTYSLSTIFGADGNVFNYYETRDDNIYAKWLRNSASVCWNPHEEHYKTENSEYTKGGLLIAALSSNYFLVEGERTDYAKQIGEDRFTPMDRLNYGALPKELSSLKLQNIDGFDGKEFESIMKRYQKLLYEMLSGKNLKAPKDIDSYETFEEFLQVALQYSQKNISLFDMKV